MSTMARLDEAVVLTGLSAHGAQFSDLLVQYGEGDSRRTVSVGWSTTEDRGNEGDHDR